MKSLTPKDFLENIATGYSVVIFGSDTCPPCQDLRKETEGLESIYPNISFYEFEARQEGSEQLVDIYRINFMPRTIFFKDGIEVGRIVFARQKEELKLLFQELESNGKVQVSTNDTEEVTRFYERIQQVLGWNFRRDFLHEEWEEKLNELVIIAHSIMDTCSTWASLSDTELRAFIQKGAPLYGC